MGILCTMVGSVPRVGLNTCNCLLLMSQSVMEAGSLAPMSFSFVEIRTGGVFSVFFAISKYLKLRTGYL